MPPAICDYEGSGYETEFWQNQGRDYEDAVERAALRKLLPPRAQRYVEFGAGFGRLADEAAQYDQIVLVDYSRSLLEKARERLGDSDKYIYVVADLNRLPFAQNAFDAGIMVRVIHHMPDPVGVLRQVRRTFAPQAVFVFEFANKLNVKAIARYITGKQAWNPFDPNPVEFVALNYDFHPSTMREWLRATGFIQTRTLAVSWLRAGWLKRRVPLKALVSVDNLLQPLGAVLPLAPSIFTRNEMDTSGAAPLAPLEALFVNPDQPESVLVRDGDALRCPQTSARWAVRDGIYDFKTNA